MIGLSCLRTIARLGSLYPFKGSFKRYQLFAHLIEPIENIVNAVFVLGHGNHGKQEATAQYAPWRTFNFSLLTSFMPFRRI